MTALLVVRSYRHGPEPVLVTSYAQGAKTPRVLRFVSEART